MSTGSNPGIAMPIEPGFIACPGGLPICRVVSVWPKPSRMETPHSRSTIAMTSGLSGSPAPSALAGGTASVFRSAWMSMRHTVGGAQKLVTPTRSMTPMREAASKRV